MGRRCNVSTTSDRFLRSQKHILFKQRYILFKLGHNIFKQNISFFSHGNMSLATDFSDFSDFNDVLDLFIAVRGRLRFVAVAVFVVYLLPLSCPSIFRKRGRWAQMSEMLLFENVMFQFGKDLFCLKMIGFCLTNDVFLSFSV